MDQRLTRRGLEARKDNKNVDVSAAVRILKRPWICFYSSLPLFCLSLSIVPQPTSGSQIPFGAVFSPFLLTMSPDNNFVIPSNPHIAELDLPLLTHSRGSGTTSPPLDHNKHPPFAMFDTQPVAFPPSDVPLEYVRHKLQREARDFWNNVETSDCTISMLIPVTNRLLDLTVEFDQLYLCPSNDANDRRLRLNAMARLLSVLSQRITLLLVQIAEPPSLLLTTGHV